MSDDIRWQQRFSNYKKALFQLKKFVDKGELNELEEQGLIKSFEYTYELAWNVLKDFYEFQGATDIQGSRDAFRTAAKAGMIDDAKTWMNMIESRKSTVHTYNEEIAEEIAEKIMTSYFSLFVALRDRLERELGGEQSELF